MFLGSSPIFNCQNYTFSNESQVNTSFSLSSFLLRFVLLRFCHLLLSCMQTMGAQLPSQPSAVAPQMGSDCAGGPARRKCFSEGQYTCTELCGFLLPGSQFRKSLGSSAWQHRALHKPGKPRRTLTFSTDSFSFPGFHGMDVQVL